MVELKGLLISSVFFSSFFYVRCVCIESIFIFHFLFLGFFERSHQENKKAYFSTSGRDDRRIKKAQKRIFFLCISTLSLPNEFLR